jgi:hypothetical protein
MRKLAVMAAAAVFVGVVAVAYAANVYTVTTAKVNTSATTRTPTTSIKSGTTARPRPAKVDFGYTVTETAGNRPSVTTDYDINFGRGIKANHLLRDARTRRPAFNQCNLTQGQNNACPANSRLGGGIVNNLAGLSSDPTSKIPCKVTLTTFVGSGQTFPPAANDGKSIKAHIWLSLRGGPPDCPLQISGAIPAQFVRTAAGLSLQFHVPKVPFQQPTPGVDNAVVEVTSSNYKAKLVNKRVRVRGRTRFVRQPRGFFEATACPPGGHPVTVKFTDASGATNTATKRAPCRR